MNLTAPSIVTLLLCSHMAFGQQPPIPPPPVPGEGMAPPASMEQPVMSPDGVIIPSTGETGVASENNGEPDQTRKRDPFWPVGYVPKKQVATPTPLKSTVGNNPLDANPERLGPPDWDAARRLLDIRGVSLIGRDKQSNAPIYLAMVGGKLVETGNTVSVTFGSRLYRWKVTGISANGISLIKIDVRSE